MSFNRGAFNRTKFNGGSVDSKIFGGFTIECECEQIINAYGRFGGAFQVDGESEMAFDGTKDFLSLFVLEQELETTIIGTRSHLTGFLLDQVLETDILGTRSHQAKFDVDCQLDSTITANRNHVEKITITGPFEPGSTIIIDSKKLTVRKNSQNALQSMTGDFIGLTLGKNKITYSDSGSTRTVQVRITHKDKFV
ncbi:phage distal tail protein [Cohnella lupini]|uniref:Tail protein n=1 Tax=Cohnella lupini TaxID=1294267 RepID=A0A3D9HZ54_9BACL|nr:phage tail domain-containing protein [Cohnella lupini]RED54802.1 tail protein [Cohnella lupini]